MPLDVERTGLFQYLRREKPTYFHRLLDLRSVLEQWLSYVPQTFPFFTNHTVSHSDEIVSRVSQILFNPNSARRATSFSSVELYLLGAAAYLHDAGMVVPDEEKTRILTTPEWTEWSTTGAGEAPFRQYESFRDGHQPPDTTLRAFLADIQLRSLISYFIRRDHHQRSLGVVQRLAADREILTTEGRDFHFALANICAGHGLNERQLVDPELYPTAQTLNGEQADIRWITTLLRLGDLLDLRERRSCAVLQRAAGPIPAESIPHWAQYERITQVNVSPDEIKVFAQCETQEEHRVLSDWLAWLESEVAAARSSTAASPLHRDWIPPKASFTTPATLKVAPSPRATYLFTDWKLQLDQDAILDRLIEDAIREPLSPVRELIQNASDALRCAQAADDRHGRVPSDAHDPPYRIWVSLHEEDLPDPVTSITERRQVLTIEDNGIGMTERVITDYFLQVGRSYYQSEEFRRTYGFAPVSRFGVGFLTTFSMSSNVTVDTNHTNDLSTAIAFTLTGPKTYLLTERGHQAARGTKISMVLEQSLPAGAITTYLLNLCKKLEFPCEVDDLGTITKIIAEDPAVFESTVPVLSEDGGELVIKRIPFARPGISGDVFTLVYRRPNGESWGHRNWAMTTYAGGRPDAVVPSMPETLVCNHGLALFGGGGYGIGYSYRADIRGPQYSTDLIRSGLRQDRFHRGDAPGSIAADVIQNAISEHLESTLTPQWIPPWLYIQRLARQYNYLKNFWRTRKGGVHAFHKKGWIDTSVAEICDVEQFASITTYNDDLSQDAASAEVFGRLDISDFLLCSSDLESMADVIREQLFENRHCSRVLDVPDVGRVFLWDRKVDELAFTGGRLGFTTFDSSITGPVSVVSHKTTDHNYKMILFSRDGVLGEWLQHIARIGVDDARIQRFFSLWDVTVRYHGMDADKVLGYVEAWENTPDLVLNAERPVAELREFIEWSRNARLREFEAEHRALTSAGEGIGS